MPIRSPNTLRVRLLDQTLIDRQQLNTKYLLELEPDRLLHNFRLQAGVPSTAEPLGGWEAPECGLRGHFVGHYLSACAHGYASTNNPSLRSRAEAVVSGMAACQIADGYLSAFPPSDLDAIETRFEGAWASYYVLHKILTGLIDVHVYCKNEQSIHMAKKLADYIVARLEKLSPEQIEGMCRTDLKPNPTNEFGGIGESLQDLAIITGDARYDRASKIFDRDWFIQPLIKSEDRLTGLHANTHIPMAMSLARRYERTGNVELRQAVEYFWEITAVARSFVNGGSTGPRPDHAEKSIGAEHWPAANRLAQTLTPKNNESCVTHNMLRLTDYLFRWSGDEKYAAFHERAYVNHVLTMQNPKHTGGYLYDHPLAHGSKKKFGHSHDSFWCCYGSTIEAYERLANGIYYLSDHELIVNQFISSDINWSEKNVTIRQEANLLASHLTQFIFNGSPNEFMLKVRIPKWTNGATIQVNNISPIAATSPYVRIDRKWQSGDRVILKLPMHVYAESMPDDPRMIAFRYGPYVLAAKSDAELVLSVSSLKDAVASVKPSDRAGTFSIKLASGETIALIPLYEIVDESFGVYFRL